MRVPPLLIATLLAVAYLSFLGRAGLHEPDEARYAEIAREMRVSGDYLIPTLNGVPHFAKPPVIYWTTAATMGLFGENEFGARMTPMLAALGVLLLTYWIGKQWFDPSTGRTAAWLLAGSLEFFILARGLCPDMVMTFWTTAAIAAFVWARTHQHPNRLRFTPFFICMGIAFATKGPMGVLVPLSMAVGWQWTIRSPDEKSVRVPWMAGMALTLLLALSWFAACSIRHPELWQYFAKYEFIDRFFSKTHGRSQPFWFFIPVLLGGWLPWTPLFPLALSGQRLTWFYPNWRRAVPWALLGWLLPPFLLLSLSGSKLMTYILPLFPGIALGLAHGLLSRDKSATATKPAVWAQIAVFALVGTSVLVAVVCPECLPVAIRTDRWFLPVWIIAIGAAGFAFWNLRQGISERRLALAVVATAMVWSALASQTVHFGPLLGTGASLRPFAERLRQEPGWEQAQIIVAGTRRHGMEFYLRRFVDATREHADMALAPSSEIQDRIHESTQHLRLASDSRVPCYVITRQREFDRGYFPQPQWDPLGKEGDFVLLQFNRHNRLRSTQK